MCMSQSLYYSMIFLWLPQCVSKLTEKNRTLRGLSECLKLNEMKIRYEAHNSYEACVCVYVSRHHFTMKSKLCYTFFSRRLIRITSKLIYTSICNVYFYMLKTVCWDFVNFKNNLSVWPFGWNCREKKKMLFHSENVCFTSVCCRCCCCCCWLL